MSTLITFSPISREGKLYTPLIVQNAVIAACNSAFNALEPQQVVLTVGGICYTIETIENVTLSTETALTVEREKFEAVLTVEREKFEAVLTVEREKFEAALTVERENFEAALTAEQEKSAILQSVIDDEQAKNIALQFELKDIAQQQPITQSNVWQTKKLSISSSNTSISSNDTSISSNDTSSDTNSVTSWNTKTYYKKTKPTLVSVLNDKELDNLVPKLWVKKSPNADIYRAIKNYIIENSKKSEFKPLIITDTSGNKRLSPKLAIITLMGVVFVWDQTAVKCMEEILEVIYASLSNNFETIEKFYLWVQDQRSNGPLPFMNLINANCEFYRGKFAPFKL